MTRDRDEPTSMDDDEDLDAPALESVTEGPDDGRRESLLVERAARDRGLVVDRLNHRLVLVSSGPQRLLFSGLQGPGTSRFAWRACGNRLEVRGLLDRARLPVGDAVVVSGKRGARSAERRVRPVRRPWMVRQVTGRRLDDVIVGIEQLGELRAALGSEHGTRRLLVEHDPPGDRLWLFVVGDRVPAVQLVSGDPGNGLTVHDGGGDVHRAHRQLARRAVAAVPGLASGAVWIKTDDMTRPPRRGRTRVEGVDADPRLVARDLELGAELEVAGPLVDHYVARAERRASSRSRALWSRTVAVPSSIRLTGTLAWVGRRRRS